MRAAFPVLLFFVLPACASTPPITDTQALNGPPPAAATEGPSSARAPIGHANPATSGQTVGLPGGGSAWFQMAPTSGKRPALLLVPEWWGLNDWIKDDASRFASQSYLVLAVDLYRGKVARDPGEAHELMRGLPEDRAIGDLEAAFDWLSARPDVDPRRIGIVGWCMGGGYALAFAVAEPRLRAAVVNYGRLVTAPDKIAQIHAALLGNFAGNDRGIDPADVRAFADQLKADHKDADIKLYDGAKHAFMNPNNKEGYDIAAANDAWTRIEVFLASRLKGS